MLVIRNPVVYGRVSLYARNVVAKEKEQTVVLLLCYFIRYLVIVLFDPLARCEKGQKTVVFTALKSIIKLFHHYADRSGCRRTATTLLFISRIVSSSHKRFPVCSPSSQCEMQSKRLDAPDVEIHAVVSHGIASGLFHRLIVVRECFEAHKLILIQTINCIEIAVRHRA